MSPGERTFAKQLAVGRLGEDFLLGAHPELRRPAAGERRWDLEGGYPDGSRRTIEVKCDQYPMLDTPNLFAERSSVIAQSGGRPGRFLQGGPWRALMHGVREFAYLFANGGTKAKPAPPVCWWFTDVPALVARLNILEPTLQIRRVRSGMVTAVGLLVPRDLLEPLAVVTVYKPEAEPNMTLREYPEGSVSRKMEDA